MKIKVSGAAGVVLDWFVAKSEGLDVVIETTGEQAERVKSVILHDGSAPPNEGIDAVITTLAPILRVRGGYGIHLVRVPSYSSDWTQGGPIIEREGIGFFCNRSMKIGARFKPNAGADWRAFAFNKHDIHHYGPTPLIAAMRCYAVSTLGDYADVPEELARA